VQEGDKFQPDRPICDANFLNIRVLIGSEYENRFPIGPIDWMIKYKDKKPVKIERSIQTIGVKSISPVLHFLEDDGSYTILKFDYYKKVPVAIDKVKNNMRIGTISYLYDTDFKLIGLDDLEKAMIPPEETPQPEDPILIIIEETELLLRNEIYVKGKVKNQGYDYLEPVRLMVECFDKQGKIIGHVRTRTFEGISRFKDTEFKAYVPVKIRDLGHCTAKLR